MLLDWLLSAGLAAGTACVVALRVHPPLHRMLDYGKLLQGPKNTEGWLGWVLDLQVPKRWFLHFYLVLSLLSAGSLWLCTLEPLGPATGVSSAAATTAACMLAVQSLRRLYECVCVAPASQATMHVSHYLAGLVFYTLVNVSVAAAMAGRTAGGTVEVLPVLVFLWAQWDQHRNHRHLALLVKYTRPSRGLFRWIWCAHYTDEVVVYAVLAWVLRARSWWFDTVAVVWVVTSLGISAERTKAWYEKNQPGRPVPMRRWAIFPFV